MVVEAVVAGAAHIGGGLQLGAVAVETADEDVATVSEINACCGAFEIEGCAAVKSGVVGIEGDRKVAGACCAEDDKFVEGVDVHAVGHVGKAATQVSGKEALAARGVELEDANVGIAVVATIVGTDGGWVAYSEDDACGVGVFI